MSKKQLKSIFNLEGYILDKMEKKDSKIFLYCHIQKITMKYKSEKSKKVNCIRERCLLHSIFEEKQVFIIVKQRKFYFSKYNKRLWESLPQVKKQQQSTTAFKKTLYYVCATQTTQEQQI